MKIWKTDMRRIIRARSAVMAGLVVICLLAAGAAASRPFTLGHRAKPHLPVRVDVEDLGGSAAQRTVRVSVTPHVDLPSVAVFVTTSTGSGLGTRTVVYEGSASKDVRRQFEAAVHRGPGETIVGGVTLAFPGIPPLTQFAAASLSARLSPVGSVTRTSRTADGEPVVEHRIR